MLSFNVRTSCGPDDIPIEVFKVLGDYGLDLLVYLFNEILTSGRIPDAWRKSVITPIFKGKGDHQDVGNYRGIKLLSHTMKILEKILEKRLRDLIEVDINQFGFRPGVGTTDPQFCLRMAMEAFREKNKPFHAVFVDLEKAYDTVPRKLIWNCLRTREVPECYIRLIQDMYRDSTTAVRCRQGESRAFPVSVGLHQGSALSPFLFIVIMDEISKDCRRGGPWDMLYADDLVIFGSSHQDVERRLEAWRRAFESKGLRVSRSKTEYLSSDPRRTTMEIQSQPVKSVDCFKYLGSMVNTEVTSAGDVAHRVRCGWNTWKRLTPVLCDRRMPMKIKSKVYSSMIRPAILYGSECWAPLKTDEQKLHVAEMRMLRWMQGYTRLDRKTNEEIRSNVEIAPIQEVARARRLSWFGHVQRRGESHPLKKASRLQVEGRRGRGRPKKTWTATITADMKAKGVDASLVHNRKEWKKRTGPTLGYAGQGSTR